MRNLFLGLAMLLTATLSGTPVQANHAVLVGDTAFTGIICVGVDGKSLLEVVAVEYEEDNFSTSVVVGFNLGVCSYINRVVKAAEVFGVHKDLNGDRFALVRVETSSDTAFYTLFWAKFTDHISQPVSRKSFIYVRETT